MHLQRPVQPALAGADRGLRLDEHQRHAVDEQDEVGSLLGLAGAKGVLLGDDVLVLFEVVEIDECDGDVLTVLAERHRLLTSHPGGELLVGLDQAVAADTHDDRPQPVEHVGGAVRLGGDTGIQADKSIAKVFFDEGFLGLAREVLVGEVVPTEA